MQALDKNHDGFISQKEFTKISKNLSKEQVGFIANIRIVLLQAIHYFTFCFQISAVLTKFDKDGDGKLDYEEFKKLLKR